MSVGSHTSFFKQKDVLHAHDVFIHARDFHQMRHSACAVAHTRQLDDNSDCGRNLLAKGPFRKIQVSHQRHGFHARDRITRTVGMNGCERAVMPRVHSLEHVQSLFATNLAYDDPVGPHSQAVNHELALSHCAFALDVGGAAFEADDMALLEL